jgi:pimeloyl-ACP methyl ester carboxylesterase
MSWKKKSRNVAAALGLSLVTGPLGGCAMDDQNDEEIGSSIAEVTGGIDPVLFIHGCPPPGVTHEQVSHFWDPMMGLFASRGYPSAYLNRFVFSGPQCASNIDFAAEISDLADSVLAATGRPRVDVVAHSMGALATRLYILQGGNRNIRDFAMVAGANHGGEGAAPGVFLQSIFGAPAYEGMKEMFPPYACEGQASGGAADIQFELNGCLTPTGRTVWRDETPWFVDYFSIRNTVDDTVIPTESACLNQRFQNDCSSNVNEAVTVGPGPGPCPGGFCPPHVTVLFDPTVWEMVYDHVRPGLFD